MDRKKIKRQRTTLSVIFLKWLCLFSITVLLIFIGIYWALTVWLTQLLQKPSLAGFLDSYRQPLFAQEYTRISRHDLQGCEFVVLDEDDSPLYALLNCNVFRNTLHAGIIRFPLCKRGKDLTLSPKASVQTG